MEEGFDKTPQVGSGNITIEIDGKEYTLKPSLHATMTLSRQHSGLHAVIEKLSRVNFEVIQQVVELGIQFKGGTKERHKLSEAIYRTGLGSDDETGGITGKCIDYVGVLMRGGRPLPKIDPDTILLDGTEEPVDP